MFIEPECEPNVRGLFWKDHSVNGHLILQSREPQKQKSFLRSLGTRLQNDFVKHTDHCATLSTDNCKYRILTKTSGLEGGYIIAIDNTLKTIINDWNCAGEAIIPEVCEGNLASWCSLGINDVSLQ